MLHRLVAKAGGPLKGLQDDLVQTLAVFPRRLTEPPVERLRKTADGILSRLPLLHDEILQKSKIESRQGEVFVCRHCRHIMKACQVVAEFQEGRIPLYTFPLTGYEERDEPINR